MAHWGWYWKVNKKHIPRTLCSKLVSIDSFKVLQATHPGFTVQPLEIKAIVEDDHLKVTYRKRKKYSYSIPIDKRPCNYGGFRSYFLCPLCKTRMRILYLAQNSTFLCRKCLNLSYESQQMRPTRRYARTSDKVTAIIKNKGGDLYKKPPRMHTDTFQKLRSKQLYYESKSNQALNTELRKWHGSKIEPYLDRFFDYVDEAKSWQK